MLTPEERFEHEKAAFTEAVMEFLSCPHDNSGNQVWTPELLYTFAKGVLEAHKLTLRHCGACVEDLPQDYFSKGDYCDYCTHVRLPGV